MTASIRPLHCPGVAIALCAAVLFGLPGVSTAQEARKTSAANPVTQAPDLDLSVQYYSRVLTPEGVVRESRYQEKMLRRTDHVWVMRELPKVAVTNDDDHSHAASKTGALKKVSADKAAAKPAHAEHAHKHFNYVVMQRHVIRSGNQVRVEFVDAQDKQVVRIAPTDSENVNFDGSWVNAFYLVDPQAVAKLPISNRPANVAHARWHESEKNGLFQRVLWDDKKMIPLVVESGDRAGTFFRRMEVKADATVTAMLPWNTWQGYAQKEYSDFLD